MKRLRAIFAGTPEFAVPSLAALAARTDVEIVAVYTQPDRPAGRGRRVRRGPVSAHAAAAGLDVRQPARLDGAACAALAALAADLLVVAAYGLILPRAALDAVRYPINVHASLLPRWRGAAPIQRAIMAGDTVTGISIMRVVERLDAGPVWLERACPIEADDTGGTLHDRLAALGGAALDAALDQLRAGQVTETEQDESAATYAHKIEGRDLELDFARDAAALERQVRALAPRPGARSVLGGVAVRVLAAHPGTATGGSAPGTVRAAAGRLEIAAGDRWLGIDALQPAGRRPMDARAFVNGYGRLL